MKKTLVLALLFLACKAFPQAANLPAPSGAFVAIMVSNMDKSVNWYSNTFGMSVINKNTARDRGAKQANLERGKLHIELIQLNSAVSKKQLFGNQPKEILGFVKFGFTVPDFGGWHKFLVKNKVRFRGNIIKDQITKKRIMIILDPDDNMIQLFE